MTIMKIKIQECLRTQVICWRQKDIATLLQRSLNDLIVDFDRLHNRRNVIKS